MKQILSPEVAIIITNYRPKLAPHLWLLVAEFTRDAVIAAAPATPGVAREMLRHLAGLTHWASYVAGLPLTGEALFRRGTIDRFITTEMRTRSAAVQSRAAWTLGRLAAAWSGEARPSTTVHYAEAFEAPYHASDTPWMWSWARAQNTELQRINAHAVLGLCRGAGLTTAELLLARVGDITVSDSSCLVQVRGDSPRRVPIDPEWVRALAPALDAAAHAEDLLVSPAARRQRREAINKITVRRDVPTPLPHRLRSTWIIEWLDRAPVAQVLAVSGLRTIKALDRHQPYLAPAEEVAA